MAAIQGGNQSPRVTQQFIGQVNDPSPGVVVSTSSVSGSIVQPYGGQLGGRLTLGNGAAVTFSQSGNLLYEGVYQYVQFYASSSGPNAQGQIVFWNDTTKSIVTPDAATTNIGLKAGITLGGNFTSGPTAVAVTKGNYAFIQVEGVAQVKFGTVTKATPAIGDAVFVNQTPSNLADAIEDTTNVTAKLLKSYLGVSIISAESSNTISPVLLAGTGQCY
jgi:hypothetical protein